MPAFRRSFLLLLGLLWWLSVARPAAARPRPPYAVAGHEKPVALLHLAHATYLVTERSVFRLEHQRFVRHYQADARIQAAAAGDTVLWLGTRQGLLRWSPRSRRAHPLALPVAEAAPSITAVFRDAQGQLWVGAHGHGVFRWANGAFARELSTPAINGGAATADGAVWIATNIGLSHWQHGEWSRYNEEGVANHEIPDNIVDNVLPDNAGNLWVVMSDAICVFAGGGQRAGAEAELPTVKFLGRHGNEVSGVAYLPGHGHLFATADGLLLLPDQPAGRLAGLAPAPAVTDEVAQRPLLVALPLPGAVGAPVLLQVDSRQRLWLAGPDGVAVLTPRQFHQLARQRKAATALATSIAR